MNVKADILSRWYALSASLTVVVGYTKSWSCSERQLVRAWQAS